jgi:xanthine dehydrogenase accessory factor
MIKGDLAHRVDELRAAREPFVHATVVRAAAPTSVRPGDSGLVLADGTIEGFVGGVCAQASVRLHAVRAMETGETILLRLVPGGAGGAGGSDSGDDPLAQDGVVVVNNPCLSGGALEIFLEPQLPAPRVAVLGDTPVAAALADLGPRIGLAVDAGAPSGGDLALVVASHGRDEEAALEQALRDGVPYVGLVASRRRGAAVLAALDVDDALRERVRTPAGLDIGAFTAEEIALSILAEIVAARRQRVALPAPAPVSAPATATDPVCGMEVVAAEATVHLDEGGRRVYFCCEGCRSTYAADPVRHAAE